MTDTMAFMDGITGVWGLGHESSNEGRGRSDYVYAHYNK